MDYVIKGTTINIAMRELKHNNYDLRKASKDRSCRLPYDIRTRLQDLSFSVPWKAFWQTYLLPYAISADCPNLQCITIVIDTSSKQWTAEHGFRVVRGFFYRLGGVRAQKTRRNRGFGASQACRLRQSLFAVARSNLDTRRSHGP